MGAQPCLVNCHDYIERMVMLITTSDQSVSSAFINGQLVGFQKLFDRSTN